MAVVPVIDLAVAGPGYVRVEVDPVAAITGLVVTLDPREVAADLRAAADGLRVGVEDRAGAVVVVARVAMDIASRLTK